MIFSLRTLLVAVALIAGFIVAGQYCHRQYQIAYYKKMAAESREKAHMLENAIYLPKKLMHITVTIEDASTFCRAASGIDAILFGEPDSISGNQVGVETTKYIGQSMLKLSIEDH